MIWFHALPDLRRYTVCRDAGPLTPRARHKCSSTVYYVVLATVAMMKLFHVFQSALSPRPQACLDDG